MGLPLADGASVGQNTRNDEHIAEAPSEQLLGEYASESDTYGRSHKSRTDHNGGKGKIGALAEKLYPNGRSCGEKEKHEIKAL